MKIRDLSFGCANVEVEGEITKKEEPKEITLRDGSKAVVADAELKDESGSITLSLWNEQIGMVNAGDKVKVVNGYVGIFKNRIRLSLGKRGKITKL